MKIGYLMPGLGMAAVGFALLFSLLASVSALAKSKQLGAMSALASGGAGQAKRFLFFVAVFAMVLGACGTFAGVARSDGERLKACQRSCRDRGAQDGKIGPSANPDPKHPRPACLCEGGSAVPEIAADDLVF